MKLEKRMRLSSTRMATAVSTLQIGVDVPSVAMAQGDCHFLGPHDPSRSRDTGGLKGIPAPVGIGVQCLDVTGRGACDLVVRSPDAKIVFVGMQGRSFGSPAP
jgi:hypothetical protein